MKFTDRLKHSWNAFFNKDPTVVSQPYIENTIRYGDTSKPDRIRLKTGGERTIINSIYNRIGVDVASTSFLHVKVDENERLVEVVKDGLNDCLTVSANKDQTARSFIEDVAVSLCDEGCIAIVPTETTVDPINYGSYDINSMRCGKIIEWYPNDVKILLYDDRVGKRKKIKLPKSIVAIVENPFSMVMNEPNSILKRLIRKLRLLDMVDDQLSSEKLNMIIQLPYSTRNQLKEEQATKRVKSLERQLVDSKYGIGYIDATEKITQLNRPLENNLLKQIEYLWGLLYTQLGINEEVLKGTANETVMLNYYNRTIEPIVSAIADSMKVKFLTKTARTQGHSIKFFRDPFRLVPITEIAKFADVFARNEILSSNELRTIIGFKPSDNPKADELQNSNMPQPNETDGQYTENDTEVPDDDDYEAIFDTMNEQQQSMVLKLLGDNGSEQEINNE